MELKNLSQNASSDPEVCKVRCFHPEAVQRIRQSLQTDEPGLAASAELFKTLGSVKRLTILHALRESELCVCDIAHLLELSVAATSQQLRQLRGQGWVAMRNDGKMVYYRLRDDAPFAHLDAELAALAMPVAVTSKQSA
ncbi:MAG: metalloregulator ArsR/SmtB family transcription factor [Salinisphaera sp.]|jgi:DNA-binding transcriptional ArsR family regulator|nr:metalloregulator ArsR/SmtB family transcription factor [Salinisphaera sp.]